MCFVSYVPNASIPKLLPDKLCFWPWQICIMLCADHGPCVSGAHNTIVTARAGKDLVSCLVSGIVCLLKWFHLCSCFHGLWSHQLPETGLLTIGPRFGGAIDDAARYFKDAYDRVRHNMWPTGLNDGLHRISFLMAYLRWYLLTGFYQGLTPYEFVEGMKKKGIRVPGIGHRYTELLFTELWFKSHHVPFPRFFLALPI